MPKIMQIGRYVLFFWAGEDGEPIHVHVAVKRPAEDSTKIWLLKNGGVMMANNNSGIPDKDLRKLQKFVALNHSRICEAWRNTFSEEPRFYL